MGRKMSKGDARQDQDLHMRCSKEWMKMGRRYATKNGISFATLVRLAVRDYVERDRLRGASEKSAEFRVMGFGQKKSPEPRGMEPTIGSGGRSGRRSKD